MSLLPEQRIRVLTEALPYIRAFSGKTIVVKYGGAAMVDPTLQDQFAEDIVLMQYVGIHPIIVHGGGPQISAMMRKLGKEPEFHHGVRVTDADTMEIVEMVLSGRINAEIVSSITRHGGKAVGLTGKDGVLIEAGRIEGHAASLGQVGKIAEINPLILTTLQPAGFVPVISPISADRAGVTYNINADFAAGAIASALAAEKLLILTDIAGILDQDGHLRVSLSGKEAQRLIQDGVISKGMLPKVEAALCAVQRGVHKAHIIDGRLSHALLLEVFTDEGVGTEIVA